MISLFSHSSRGFGDVHITLTRLPWDFPRDRAETFDVMILLGFSKCEWEKKRENMKSKGTTLDLDLTNDVID